MIRAAFSTAFLDRPQHCTSPAICLPVGSRSRLPRHAPPRRDGKCSCLGAVSIPPTCMTAARTKSSANPNSRRARTHIGPWQLGRTLGRGSSGRVRLSKHSETGQLAAVKIVPKSMVESTYGIEREVIIMKLIEHPNIMGLYDVWENKGELYLVLEYIEGGELFDYLVRRGRLSEREAVHYFRQICNGVQYCHQFNICHRDLKPENLLLDRHRNIKIADFGMAALETAGRMLETSCGSPHYASPEIVAGRTYHGAPSDIWSCGIILFALLTGHLPFDDDNIRVLLRKVQAGRYSIPSYVSPEARDLISRILRVDPADRITMRGILRHPLLLKYPARPSDVNVPKPVADATHPVATIEDVDPEILRNLQTLWHHDSAEDIVKQLLVDGPTPEKTFYCLLLKYRQNHRRRNAKPSATSSPRISHSMSKRSMAHSKSRSSIHSRHSLHSRSNSQRSLRAVPKSSRVSMASVQRFVAERPAPRAPKERTAREMVREQAREQAREYAMEKSTEGDGTRSPIKVVPRPDRIDKPGPASGAPTAKLDETGGFADLIDRAFGQRSSSAVEAGNPGVDDRRTVSDSNQNYLLPMIFEERAAEPTELPVSRVRRKPVPVNSGAASTPTLVDGEFRQKQLPVKHSPASAPKVSQISSQPRPAGADVAIYRDKPPSPNPTKVSVSPQMQPISGRRESLRRPSANNDSEAGSAKTGPVLRQNASVAAAQFANANANAKPSRPSGPPGPSATTQPQRRPLETINNIYPPLVAEEKSRSTWRRFTPKKSSKTPVIVSSTDYSSSAVVEEDTKQNWLLKMLNLGGSATGPQKTLLSVADVSQLREVILQVLADWSKYGLTQNSAGSTITATINSKNAFRLRMSRFTIRVQALSSGSSAVCTQVRGAQSSYMRFVGELEHVLNSKNLLGAPESL